MKNTINNSLKYIFLTLFGLGMIYPIIWMIFASFKTDAEIFSSIGLLTKNPVFDSYTKGWKSIGQNNYGLFYLNTIKLVFPTVLLTIGSSTLTAYGFSRFIFPGKRLLFSVMLATLMLPQTILIIPRYIIFSKIHWLDTFLPFYVPAALATNAFFIFMLVQFLRGLPKELDESALIDGCGSMTILIRILTPVMKPALFSAGLFQFIWTWNNFFDVLVMINSVKKFPLALALRISIDIGGMGRWNQVIAMAVLAMLPCIIIFFASQKYFVEGIATSGIKG